MKKLFASSASALSLFVVSASQVLAVNEIDIKNAANRSNIIVTTNLNVSDVITWVIVGLFAIASLAAIIFLIWGGISWILSGGDKGKVDAARQRIVAAIVGLIIVILTFVILNFVIQIIGAGSGITNICIPKLSNPNECVK